MAPGMRVARAAAAAWLLLLHPALGKEEDEEAGLEGLLHKRTEDRIVEVFGQDRDFLWGAATAAYQVEGAWNWHGRQLSIWDVFSHKPLNTYHNQSGDVADNFFQLYKSDIQLVSSYGFNAFRFSISWTRIFTTGLDGVRRANLNGVAFYKNMIAALRAKNITPLVTLYHWDLPAEFDWLSDSIVDRYLEYADFIFRTFPEIKYWVTFNEPWTFCTLGYKWGVHAPGVKSEHKHLVCGHNVLRAHARAVALYREKYRGASKGQISITLNYDWGFPLDASNPADVAAAQLHHDFHIGWFADPVYLSGDYPASMRQRLGHHLPVFSEEEKALLRGSYEGFYGLNTYSGSYVTADNTALTGYTVTSRDSDGVLIGAKGASSWLHVVPQAIRAHLEYIYARYRPPAIYITENGCDVPGESNMPLAAALEDTFRVDFYRSYIGKVAAAIRESGVPVKGYFAWSLLDNFEWADGYGKRFGLTYVNYTTQKRYPKNSAKWFTALMGRLRPATSAKPPHGDQPDDQVQPRRHQWTVGVLRKFERESAVAGHVRAQQRLPPHPLQHWPAPAAVALVGIVAAAALAAIVASAARFLPSGISGGAWQRLHQPLATPRQAPLQQHHSRDERELRILSDVLGPDHDDVHGRILSRTRDDDVAA